MARVVNFNDGAESETTPVIGKIVASNLVQYPDDATYEATELDSPVVGNIYYNTTLNLIRYYNGTLWISLVDESSNQELSNKEIDADTNTITNLEDENIKVGAAIDAEKIHDGSVTNTEFGYIGTLTANAQDQLDDKQDLSEKGQANGYVPLNGATLIDAAFLPSYVDDVLEFADFASFPVTGETGKIYIAIDTGFTYRWTGSIYVQIGGSPGANDTLSNLASPTAINQDLIPDGTRALGQNSNTTSWRYLFTRDITMKNNGTIQFNDTAENPILDIKGGSSAISLPSGLDSSAYIGSYNTTDDKRFAIFSYNDGSANANPTDSIALETGNKTAGTGNSGDISLRTGTSSGGTRGAIQLQNGSEGTVGHVWTATDATGKGSWQAASGGANTALSNLASTSINQNLVPDVSATKTLGSSSIGWETVFLRSSSASNGILLDTKNSGGTQQLTITSNSTEIPSGGETGPHIQSRNTGEVLALSTRSSTSATASGDVLVESGNNNSTGDTGDIAIRTGVPSSGARGTINLQDGSEGTIGHIWTSTGVAGQGNWAEPVKNKVQTKILSTNQTSDGTMSDLTFNNLVIGRWYEITGSVSLAVNDGVSDTSIEFNATHDSAVINRNFLRIRTTGDTLDDIKTYGISFKFLATATTLTFAAGSATVNSYVRGSGSRTDTYVQIEERNDLVITTDFT